MDNTTTGRVAANVRAETARAGMSQRDLARALHMPPSSLYRRLSGGQSFTVDELVRISEALSVPLTVLVGDATAAA